jgi:Mg-chelatase subunit ChlD
MQIRTLARLVQTDLCLVDPFLEGLSRGLGLLAEPSLMHFVDTALKRYGASTAAAIKYLGLSSKVAQDDCAAMQQAVPLNGVRGRLNRYLQARIGRSVVVRPLSDLGITATAVPWVCSDGRTIYLTEENSYFSSAGANADLYKTLTRLEAGYFEYGTFDFDLERAVDRYPEVGRWIDATHRSGQADACDGEIFVCAFPSPELANDLFTLFEQIRIAGHMHCDYPGLMRSVRPALRHAFDRIPGDRKNGLLAVLYGRWMLDLSLPVPDVRWQSGAVGRLTALYAAHRQHHRTVEKSADLVCRAMQVIVKSAGHSGLDDITFDPPFGRRLHWDLVSTAFSRNAETVDRLKAALDRRGLHVYRSDVRRHLADRDGRLNVEDIKALVLSAGGAVPKNAAHILASVGELDGLLGAVGVTADTGTANQDPSFRYPEWDVHLQEYLYDHTWVREIVPPDSRDVNTYRETLARHHGLVTRMRRAFELLKPEGMALLRQWPEGDAFDYRALIDFVIDRRAGRIPSQRLYIKRLKSLRDVAVLLLVDLSRSTANPAEGRQATVLAVAKEALVLFCEALQVSGDRYAIAGFSGTGRHNVDYFRIKDFDEPLSPTVQARISALTPQRSTRMGAAVRHAAEQLNRISSRVRLLIVLSDGFPNDLGYKSDYAIADTGRAVQEARAKNFHVKAITVNIGSDPRLDELYGRVHHQVIGDVTELPDKLLRWYGILTRC